MRGYAELLRRNPHILRDDVVLAMRRIDGETQRRGVLVDDLLLLARLDQGRLGLSIVAAVVQAHGGRIRVLHTRGGGAIFRIELDSQRSHRNRPGSLEDGGPS